MQFNYVESEDGGGTSAKRHLGSEIHLKLLIPRFTDTFKLLILTDHMKISAMLRGM